MALNVIQSFAPKYQIVMSSKIIDMFAFKKRRSIRRTCPICGRVFDAKIDIDDPSPKEGTFCSRDCYNKFIYTDLAKRTDNKSVQDFIKSKENIINTTIYYMLDNPNRDINLSKEDMKHNANIALYYLYARSLRKNKNPYEYTQNYIIRTVQRAMCLTTKEKELFYNHSEESVLEEQNNEGISTYCTTIFDIDKQIDLQNIIKKIIKLSQNNEHVKIALARALISEGHLKENENSRLFYDYCNKNFGITKDFIAQSRVKKGTEHIYYNDYKNISQYININNLKNKYSFNKIQWETISEEELGKEIAHLLDFYSRIVTCSVCGKRFKARNEAQAASRNPVCSNECMLEARRRLKKKQREKQGCVTGEIKRQCAICGKTFLAKANSIQHKNVYCSEECRHEAVLEQKRKQWARYQANKTDKQRKREKERKRQNYMKNREQLLRKQQERRERKKKEKQNIDI